MQSFEDRMLGEALAAASTRGVSVLREHQLEVLRHLARGECLFASLPTGYGKSLCYWLPACAWDWRVWVISPLISLIEDQAMACRAMGVEAIAWVGGSSRTERAVLEQEMGGGRWKICFLSPERLHHWAESGYLQALVGMGLGPDLLAIDEMHCLEEWREFRTSYQDLFAPVRNLVARGSLLLGLSASLSLKEGRSWMKELCGDFALVETGIGRENLWLEVRPVEAEEERWIELLAALKGLTEPDSALIYCASREEADEISRWLRSAGLPAVAYHAGLPGYVRSSLSEAFRAGRLRIVCATSAFGMGIDYPHVSRVIHFSTPHDLESYWQEVGRAGRSGQPARALAFWRRSEVGRAERLSSRARERYHALWRAWSSGRCRRLVVAERLGLSGAECGRCDACVRAVLGTQELGAFTRRETWWTQEENELSAWVQESFGES